MKIAGGCKWHMRRGWRVVFFGSEKGRLRSNLTAGANAQLVHDGKGTALKEGPSHVEKSPSLVMLKTHRDKDLSNLMKF